MNPIIEPPNRGLNLNYTFSNRSNSTDLMFLLKGGVFFIIRRISFSSNTNYLFSLVSKLKHSKEGKWLQSNTCLLTALPLGLTYFLVYGEIRICFSIFTLRCLTHSP